ncbi:hypothetical protein SOVF_112000 [Spinacia oleracea]|uniref:Uncharacterized protein n=1 Tax=Spinacia oleracea TaxID=3562 RepID=A0A9R0K4S7_SPIOL|nr:uncharacterized protein LOC110797660 [Spinacia oleracea]KNA13945.1 hypothetical protein SOVF_112000 [Spinacia oleracea]
MEDGKGECCIARWGGGHTAAVVATAAEDYCNTSKMDMIMLKFRPIAPKPVVAGTTTTTASESGGGSQGNGSSRHAKAGGRGRKKTNNSCSNNRKCNNNNNHGRKRKSSSPDRRNDYPAGNPNQQDPTLLPLFPEAPDLSPTGQDQVHNVMPFWHNIDCYNNNNNNNNNDDGYTSGSSPSFDGNFNNCHVSSWW